jgi:hypothetical protein
MSYTSRACHEIAREPLYPWHSYAYYIANPTGAVELVKELDGLPLALSTASAYLEHVSMTLLDYLRLYKALWLKL